MKDISWLDPDGAEMTDERWSEGHVRWLGMRLAGEASDAEDGKPGETLLALWNADSEAVLFRTPSLEPGSFWERLLDTAEDETAAARTRFRGGHRYPLKGRSVAVFRLLGR